MSPQKLPAQTKMSVESFLNPSIAVERLANNLPASSSSRSERKMEGVLKDLMGVLGELHK
ncbi:hypothetical protein BPAE_0045g00270 [Botrytis paeoniae]|uniref:Uncharacterized protein n=1 Tax=Botrytis paeoniae TaxID=278948 RepID=A0A4Z1FVA9_9HELO|nr:hypothetical protein BPAE_0045g00270 [Botrytis paeoniae]